MKRSSSVRRFALFALVVLCCGTALYASAQETGGSFGGGDFGGGGGSDYGGGGGSDYGGGGGSDYGGGGGSDFGSGSSGSSDYGGGSSGSSDYGSSWGGSSSGGGSRHRSSGAETMWVLLGAVLLIGLYALIAKVRERGSYVPTHSSSSSTYVVPRAAWTSMDVTVLKLGIDWRARRVVQAELDRLARTGNTKSNEGLVAILRRVSSCLQSVELAWLYAGVENASPMPAQSAEATFRRAALEARSRFKRELVRNVGGTTTTEAAPERKARAHEGEGVVVVTLVVAARKELQDVRDPRDAGEMRSALGALARLGPGDLVALEVVWSPAEERDRMSTAELEAKYPELRKVHEGSIAGRVFCTHCNGPHAAELAQCPHCGAPSGGVSPSSS